MTELIAHVLKLHPEISFWFMWLMLVLSTSLMLACVIGATMLTYKNIVEVKIQFAKWKIDGTKETNAE